MEGAERRGNLQNATPGFHKYDIECETHAKRVNRSTVIDPEALTRSERWPTEQAARPLPGIRRAAGPFQNGPAAFIKHTPLSQRIPCCLIIMTIGNASTMKVVGKINKTKGSMSFTGASMANFSARWNRSVRRRSA